ncbi:MAG: Gfo/Idh/MocA family oxidoreductase [Verrucomicrobiales bacterium]
MPEKTITVAVVTEKTGAHLGAYFEALRETEECEAVVVCDPSGTHFEAAKKTLGDKLSAVFKSTDAMLTNAKPGMALVSMEGADSPPVVDKLLDAGVHVLAEKPACTNLADFENLVRKAEAGNLRLMLALANRITPAVQKAKSLVAEGLLGDLYGASIHMVADQTRLRSESYHSSWYADRSRAGGGILMWLGIHWLDLAALISGEAISDVAGFTGIVGGQPLTVEDSAAMAIRFGNGAHGTMNAGYYTDKGYHSFIKLWGSGGWLEYQEHLGDRTSMPLKWYSNKDPKAGIVEYDGPMEPKGYTPYVRRCVQACAGLTEAPITGAEGLSVLRTIFRFYEAADKGIAASLDGPRNAARADPPNER